MLVSETVYQAVTGERKQLTMEGWAADALKRNPEMTKGLTAYECLLMADDSFEDKLTRAENRVLDELAAETGDDVRAALDDLVESRIVDARERLVDACEYHDPWEDVYPVELYVVSDVDEELPGRGASSVIEDAIAWTAASPWSSRFDRLSDLQDLLMVARNEGAPSDASEFVRVVERGESDRWNVGRLHSIISPDIEFWERTDLTTDDLVDDGTTIPQGPKRVTALETALTNYDAGVVNRDSVRNYAEMFFDDVSSDTARGYAEDVNLGRVNAGIPTVELDVDGLIDRLYQDTRDRVSSISETRQLERDLEDYEVAGFDEDPREISDIRTGQVLADYAHEEIEKLRELINGRQNGYAEENEDKIRTWCASKEQNVDELLNDN